MEPLERRAVFSASNAAEPVIASMMWEGRPVEAVRDSWVMRMPQTNRATAASPLDYVWTHPAAPPGWTLEPFGYGFYGVTAPGASVADVSAWHRQVGATSWQPNTISATKAATHPAAQASLVPNDPLYNDLWGLSQIDVTTAWQTTTGASDIIVGVIDSGIDYNHPDLAANMWRRPATVPSQINIAPGVLVGLPTNDRTVPIGEYGINTGINTTGPTEPMDTQGHGTHVAGTIAAAGNNSLGVVGVAPKVRVFAAKTQFAFNANGQVDPTANRMHTMGTIRAMAAITALKRTYQQNFVSVNASYGGLGPPNSLEREAIELLNAAGIVFVAAAGNGGPDQIGDDNDIQPQHPANYDVPNVISVAASDELDGLTDFSNFGRTTVDIAAPGTSIWSTYPTALPEPFLPDGSPAHQGYQPGYLGNQGTSMASPHVAGVAALIASAYRDVSGRLPTVAEIKSAILDGADEIETVAGVSGLTNPVTRGRIAGDRRLSASGAMREILTPSASIVAPRPSGKEGNVGVQEVQFTIRLTLPVVFSPVEVTYETIDGTAIAGEDFIVKSGSVVFAEGEQEKTVTVMVNGDTDLEPDEHFALSITEVVNARIGPQQRAQYTLVNDEKPVVSIKPAVGFESTGRRTTALFEVTYLGEISAPIILSYGTRDGTAVAREDYQATQGTVMFHPGDTKKQVSVGIIGDTRPEVDETFFLVVSGSRNSTVGEDSQAVAGYIVDDDSRTVSVVAVSPTVVGGVAAAFRVSLSRQAIFGDVFPTLPEGVQLPSRTLSATVGSVSQSTSRGVPSALAGTNYTTVTKTLLFTPGTLAHTVAVPTALVDRRRAFTMRIGSIDGVRVSEGSAEVSILASAGDGGSMTSPARGRRPSLGSLPVGAWRGWGRG